MTRSSPARRSQLPSSPDRAFLSRFLSDDRNNEDSHLDALAAAQVQHERVREAAIRVYELHELQEKRKRILEEQKKEEERLKAEAESAAEAHRLNELRAKSVPKPAPLPEPQPIPEKKPETKTETKLEAPKPEPAKSEPEKQPVPESRPSPASNSFPPTRTNGGLFNVKPADTKSPAPVQQAPTPAAATAAKPNGVPPAATPKPQEIKPIQNDSPRKALADRYTQIHQELKKLRKHLTDEAKRPESPLKGKLGQARRDIRMAIGQLTGSKGANSQPSSKIMATLRATLDGTAPSPPVQVSTFVTENRQPVEGAAHNDDKMPALFIYLVNIFAKGIINQFITEAGANPKAADPVGVFTAAIFSTPEFQWRGRSLIDILMAKFRVVCPALFGLRGNDRTERGRNALGWRRDGPSWITEQSHNDRMTGLAAGFAAVALRDFGKSKKENPYPPTNYWMAIADILNTPQGLASNTQCIVLRGMIEGHEQRFLNFYGNAAFAVLRIALIDFPNRAPESAAAAGSLRALGEMLKADGLYLG